MDNKEELLKQARKIVKATNRKLKNLDSKGYYNSFSSKKLFERLGGSDSMLKVLDGKVTGIKIKKSPIPPVMTSGTSLTVVMSIIKAKAPIAQCAPCSRYKNLANVFFSTNIIVRDLTNIAPIAKPIVMIKTSLLKAKAPKTPSKEKEASISSK